MTLSLRSRAALWGGRTAAVDHGSGRRVSYADLDDRADRAARRLVDCGVSAGDAVVVCSHNRIEHVELFFGARRVGATLAPVSHRLPADDVAALAGRVDPAVAVVESRFADLAADADLDALTLGEFRERDLAGGDDPAGGDADDVDGERRRGPDGENAGAGTGVERAGVGTGDAGLPADAGKRHGQSAGGDRAPALYLHTGGTTGPPKVVVVEDRQVEWNCITEAAAWGLGADAVSPVLLPMYHTGGWLILTLPTLYVGGTLVLLREFDPGEALDAVERYGATRVFGVAAMFRAMADDDAFDGADFSSVRWFMSGGGPTPASVRAPYRDRGETFVQGYGLTEGGPNNLYVPPGSAAAAEKPDSVGRPFPDCEVRVVAHAPAADAGDGTVDGGDDQGDGSAGGDGATAGGGGSGDGDGTDATGDGASGDDANAGTGAWAGDGALRPVDAGEVGELLVRGPVTARRYRDADDGTFADPDGWVRTGDLCRVDADGDHYVVGRVDNAFVAGGENVSPERVEGVLADYDGVDDVGVVPIPHERWGRVPKAVVAGDADPDALEAFARERLADHQRPRAWAFVDDLPRSGPGKLDREALARRFGDGA